MLDSMVSSPKIARFTAVSVLGLVAGGATALALNDRAPARVEAAYRTPVPPSPSLHTREQPPSPPAAKVTAPPSATAGYTVKSVLPIEGPLRYGEWHWDEGAATSGGATVITVDLAARVLSVFRNGHEIGATAVIYGADEKPTPLGVFPVTQKDAHHVSNLYGAPMPYMLRMTNDGISIHGSEVSAELMTHGCVGVPTAFARKLFGTVKLGDKVIVTRGETLDVGQPITAA